MFCAGRLALAGARHTPCSCPAASNGWGPSCCPLGGADAPGQTPGGTNYEVCRGINWFTLEDLGGLIRRHRADDTVHKAISRILRAELIVVDDIGLLPVAADAADAAEGLYRLVDAADEKRSVAISSNLHPAGFDELMPKTLATATVDRLLHHAHICQTSGDSVRLSQALTGRGVTPLT